MTRKILPRAVLALVVLAASGVVTPGAAGQTANCEAPATDPQPDTPAWHQREADNAYCGEQRFWDTSANPGFAAAKAENLAHTGQEKLEDPFRDPWRGEGSRFRHEEISFTNQSGQRLPGLLFLPCDSSCHGRPRGIDAYSPRYPGVVIVHGGGATQEMYLWAAEGLAESGYMVLMFQIPTADNTGGGTHYDNSKAALDYFLSTPGAPAAGGDVNPAWADLDRRHVGLAGHSAGGVAVSRLGQEDRRVSAIVSWDRAQSSPMPAGLRLRTPVLFFVADYNCQQVPVCVPQPYTTPPDPDGPGNKGTDYQRVRAARVDTMKIALRAATHLDFTQLSPGTGSRYGATVAFYYTLAWFDRYLKGATSRNRRLASDALKRLTATTFDDSSDVHNVSGGTWDPLTQSNVPARIGGKSVVDRLSFHFRSSYFLDGGRRSCKDMRAGCHVSGLDPGCDPSRPALAHRAGGAALSPQPASRPIPCMTFTGNAIEAATIGVTRSGAVFFGSIEQNPDGVRTIVDPSVVARSRDRGRSWQNVVPGGLPTSPHGSLSTWLSVDPTTSRVWYATPAAPCGATVSWSDDDGETWGLNPNVGCLGQGAAALIEGPAPAGTEQPVGYPHVVYYCANAQDGEESVLFCNKSLDGGQSWSWIGSTPDAVPAQEGCSPQQLRTTRAGEVGPDGVLYFPTLSCDHGSLGIAISTDQGKTWTRHEVTRTEVQDLYPPAIGIDADSKLYLAWKGPGGLPYLAVSADRGASWSAPAMIAPPQVNGIRRLGIVARGRGHALISYLGTTDGGATFNAYMTESSNAGEPQPLFWSAAVNDPAKPVLRQGASETFGDRIQFLRGHIADDGTPWAAFHCFDTELCPGERIGIAAQLRH